jgi:FMN-dependent oxidoreductase (nitrilotriacetate monooxygenase family)
MIPKNDPCLLVPAMAAVTQHVGFGITCSVGDEIPYAFARRMSTLDHLTNGRIGWNIVTGFLESSAKAKGDTRLMDHDERYDMADEFMAAVYQLWEGSWEDDAVLRDVESGVYADPAKVHRVRHEGKYFKLDAIHMSEPSPQRTPLLFQAGTSARGIEFAAQHAECVFLNGSKIAGVGARIRKIRDAAENCGRRPEDILALAGLTVIVAPTDTQAEEKHAEYNSYVDHEGGMVKLSGFIGADLSTVDPSAPIQTNSTNGIKSILENIVSSTSGEVWTAKDVANPLDRKGRNPLIVGSPKSVADQIEQWVTEADIDGFNLSMPVRPDSISDFIDLVVPELQRRKMFKTEYAEGTLRRKMFGRSDRTPPNHSSAGARRT